jgi:hypothetical protein
MIYSRETIKTMHSREDAQRALDRKRLIELRENCVKSMRSLDVGESMDASKTKHGQRNFRNAMKWAERNLRHERYESRMNGIWMVITRTS